jgi:F0F1-type ATP synthase membrane subunit c/vacuolar-type H+-ATPase subunit K
MSQDTPPRPSQNWLPIIWLAAGVLAIGRGLSLGSAWLAAGGAVAMAVGVGLLLVRRSERLRKWEPGINLFLLVVVSAALVAVFLFDLQQFIR